MCHLEEAWKVVELRTKSVQSGTILMMGYRDASCDILAKNVAFSDLVLSTCL